MIVRNILEKNILNIVIALLFTCGFFARCANPMAPSGGPRDSLPPFVVMATPTNFSTNFNSKRVVIEFNEYIQLKETNREIVVSPPMERKPMFTTKGRAIVIDFKSPLDSATTYKIDFGNSISDNNEGNKLTGFSYIFSTGESIDSLAMSGQVLDAVKGDSILNAMVFLFDAKSDSMAYDSTMFVSKIASVARTDSAGVFLATNLRNIDYRIYAIVDKNGNQRYEPGDELVAFLDTVYNPSEMSSFDVWYNTERRRVESTPQFKMKVFSEMPTRRQMLTTVARQKKHQVLFIFSSKDADIRELKIDSVTSENIIVQKSLYADSLNVWIDMTPETLPDTLKGVIKFMSQDSVGNPIVMDKKFALGFPIPPKKRKGDIETNPFGVEVKTANKINPLNDISFLFSYPIKEFRADSVTLIAKKIKEDIGGVSALSKRSTAKEKEEPEEKKIKVSFVRDSSNILLWRMKTALEPSTNYNFLIPSGAIINIAGEKNDTLKTTFTTFKPEEFGIINISATKSNASDSTTGYIIELMSEKGNSVTHRKKFVKPGDKVKFEYIAPGNIKIRITEDKNNNGIWDSGDLINRRQPEKVAIYKDAAGGTLIESKGNWDIDLDINLEEAFQNSR